MLFVDNTWGTNGPTRCNSLGTWISEPQNEWKALRASLWDEVCTLLECSSTFSKTLKVSILISHWRWPWGPWVCPMNIDEYSSQLWVCPTSGYVLKQVLDAKTGYNRLFLSLPFLLVGQNLFNHHGEATSTNQRFSGTKVLTNHQPLGPSGGSSGCQQCHYGSGWTWPLWAVLSLLDIIWFEEVPKDSIS
jgi:hypothetical protein